jgi:hypothetical protein
MYDSIVGMTGAVLGRDKRGCVRINNSMERDFYGNFVIGPCENKNDCHFHGKKEKRRKSYVNPRSETQQNLMS